MKRSHRIRVLGRELPIRSSATAENVHAVETFVNDRIGEVQKTVIAGDALTVAILALMNLAEAHLKFCQEHEEWAERCNERLAKVVRSLEAVQ